jgi:hypothetical protein
MLGHPQFVFLVSVAELFVLGAVLLSVIPSAAAATTRRRAAGWGIAKTLGFATAGIALVPVAESLSSSFRAAPPEGFVADFNITPLALVQLVGPYLLQGRAPHENLTEIGFYLGAVPTVLLVYAALRGRAVLRWHVARAAIVLAAVALVLSLGNWGLLYRVQAWLPVVGLFRAPARYVVLVELAGALVAAIAFADLVRRPARPSRRLSAGHLAALLAPAILGLLALGLVPFSAAPLAESWALRAAGPAALGVAGFLVWASTRGARFAPHALLVLAIVDLGAYGASFVARSEPQTIDAFLERYRTPARPGDDRLHWGPPALTMKGFRLAGGYAAMTPDRLLDLGPFAVPLTNIDARLANALRVSGVRWAIGTRLPEPLARARLLSDARQSSDPNHDIGAIDVATTALVDVPVKLDVGPSGSVEVALDAPGEMELFTTAPGRQLLVVSESYHEGWRAEVDGRPSVVHRAYGDYLGCVVGPGRQRVTLRFEPSSLEHGARLSLLALGGTGMWLAVGWLRDRGRSRPA